MQQNSTAVQLPGNDSKVIQEVFKTIDLHEEGMPNRKPSENTQITSAQNDDIVVDEMPEVDLTGVNPAFQSAYGAADCHEEEEK